jgi:hypothetical protein
MREQIRFFQMPHTKPITPKLQDIGWGAVVQTAVDLAAAADTTSFHKGNLWCTEGWIEPAATVLLTHFLYGERLTRVNLQVRPLFDHHNVETL